MASLPSPSALLTAALAAAFTVTACDAVDPAEVEQARSKVERAGEAVGRATESLKKAGEVVRGAATNVVLPPAREEALGYRMAAEIASQSRVLPGGPLVAYVEALGTHVVAAADERNPAIDFEFHVIDDEAINAFAIPGGHIYVTTGLLRAAGSEAEVVAVLGHEIAHVTRRHIAERMAAVYGVSTLTNIALGQEVGVVGQIAADLLARGFLLKHSRDDEREADTHGMAYVIEAGYSPLGYETFFERLAEQPRPPVLLSTHPDPEQRAARAREAIAALDPAIVARPLHRERHLKVTSPLR